MGLSGLTNHHSSIDDIKSLLDGGDLDEALIMIEQSDENKIELQILKSTILHMKGMTTRALEEAGEALVESRKGNNEIYLMDAILHFTRYSLLMHPEQHTIDQFIAEFQKIWNELSESEKEKEETREIEGNYYSVLALRHAYYNSADYDGILLEMKKDIEIQKQLKHKFRLFQSLHNLSAFYEAMGNFQIILEIGRETQDLAEKLNNRHGLSSAYATIGIYYFLTGNYNKSEEYFNQKLEIDNEYNLRHGISLSYHYLGKLAFEEGIYDKALKLFSKSLGIADDLNRSQLICSRLFDLIMTSLKLNSEKLVNSYMSKLQKLNDTTDLPLIHIYTLLAQALIYKNNSRSKDKAEAQKLLAKIIDENLYPSMEFKYVMLAMLHLSELLLDELKTYGNEEVLNEADDLIRKLYEMAQERQLFYEIIHILILQSKLRYLDLKLDKAYKILQQAHLIAEERGLIHLLPTIESEEMKLEEEIGLALEISKLAAPIQKRLEKSKIVNYIIEMQNLMNKRN